MPRLGSARAHRCIAFRAVPTAVPPPPPPAPAAAAPVPTTAARVRPGQLTRPWQVATVAAWGLTLLALIGVWKASRELGLATWWKGPESQPQPFLVMLLPFYLPLGMMAAALYNVRLVPWLGVGAGLVTGLVGIGDLGRVARFGVIEVALGAAMTVFSLASLSGRYRRPI